MGHFEIGLSPKTLKTQNLPPTKKRNDMFLYNITQMHTLDEHK
jgi:hypothetical protein